MAYLLFNREIMRLVKFTINALSLAVISLALTGCPGGGSDSSSPTPAPTPQGDATYNNATYDNSTYQ